MGKHCANMFNHTGALSVGTKTSEINNRGSIDALTIAGAASALGIKDIMATPKQLNVAAPSSNVNI